MFAIRHFPFSLNTFFSILSAEFVVSIFVHSSTIKHDCCCQPIGTKMWNIHVMLWNNGNTFRSNNILLPMDWYLFFSKIFLWPICIYPKFRSESKCLKFIQNPRTWLAQLIFHIGVRTITSFIPQKELNRQSEHIVSVHRCLHIARMHQIMCKLICLLDVFSPFCATRNCCV